MRIVWLVFVALMLVSPEAQALVRKGGEGEDVIEVQARLQNIGYYHDDIDGQFGWKTYWSVRRFQERFKLPIDGVVGEKTLQRLRLVSHYNEAYVLKLVRQGVEFTYYGGLPMAQQIKKTARPTSAYRSYSARDIQLLANAVHGEARGEPYVGQVAVAAVVINRLHSPAFPDTVAGIIFEPGAFTAVSDGQIYLAPNETAKKAVIEAINGWDPTNESIYYFNPATATNKWIWSRPQVKKIGKHIFCK